MKPAVVLIIFNRPHTTRLVFERVRAYQPDRLLVIADGPRSRDEAMLCEETRAVVRDIDWPCDVLTNFAIDNMGCNKRVSSGLTWVFEQCSEAIVLEDDCVPDTSFFTYCADLLDYYRHDQRIMMINGCNFQFGHQRTPYSYYYSSFPHIWGWATWRRAWHFYNIGYDSWSLLRATRWLESTLDNKDAAAYFRIGFDTMSDGAMTWDYQWNFAIWAQHALVIAPTVNLVANVGFGSGATNALNATHRFASLPTQQIELPLQHPPLMVCDSLADRYEFAQEVPSSLYYRLRRQIGSAMPKRIRKWLYYYLTLLDTVSGTIKKRSFPRR